MIVLGDPQTNGRPHPRRRCRPRQKELLTAELLDRIKVMSARKAAPARAAPASNTQLSQFAS